MQADTFRSSIPITDGEQLFSNESFETLEKFDCLGQIVEFRSGETLFSEGQRCEYIYVFSLGSVKLRIAGSHGRSRVIGIESAGEIVGLAAAINDGIHEATAEAAGYCRGRAIKRQSVLNLLSASPTACVRAAQAVIRSHRSLSSSQHRLGLSLSATGRIAGLLLDWAGLQEPQSGFHARCMLRFTQREMAAMAATTCESVTRILARFKREKLISIRGAALSVLDPQALEEMRGY